jgi:hypothetical protein
MKFQKVLFLFLALLLPVVIFIFLKSFGKNEFAVQPLFQDAVESPVDCENFQYHTPYVIKDSSFSRIFDHDHYVNDTISLVVIEEDSESHNRLRSHLYRIIKEGRVSRVIFMTERIDTEVTKASSTISTAWSTVRTAPERLQEYARCIFLLKPTDNVLIVDSKMRIRGQYNLLDREDADRLIMEMLIIQKQY